MWQGACLITLELCAGACMHPCMRMYFVFVVVHIVVLLSMGPHVRAGFALRLLYIAEPLPSGNPLIQDLLSFVGANSLCGVWRCGGVAV
jgi:hypothetical protein